MIALKLLPQPDGRVKIVAPYHKRFVDVAHTLPGLTWNKPERAWFGYQDSVEILSETLVNEGVAKVGVVEPTSPRVSSMSVLSTDIHRATVDQKLYAYQKEARDFLLTRAHEGVILADGLGLGKTRTTLAAIAALPVPAVVVCPSIVKRSWVKEGAELGLDVFSLSGVKPPTETILQESDGIVVINYDIVYAWKDVLSSVKTIVFDEAHNLSNSKSRRSEICKELAKKADYRIALTGTPFSNKPIELWNVVDTISPGRFSSYVKYGIRYAEGHQDEIEIKGEKTKVWNFKGKSHTDELSKRLKQFMIRRTKEDVALELPLKTRQIIELDVAGESLPDVVPIDADVEWMRYALSLSARGKMKHAVELTLGHLREESSVVLAAYRHEIANELRDLLAAEGVEAFMATGEKTIKQRLQAMKDASENQPSVTIVTTHGVGEGINELTYANVSIIVELDYSPRWIVQYEGRFHRQGQKRNVLFQYLIGIGSLDEIIRDRVLSKLKTFEDVVGAMDSSLGADLAGDKTDDDIMAELLEGLRNLD